MIAYIFAHNWALVGGFTVNSSLRMHANNIDLQEATSNTRKINIIWARESQSPKLRLGAGQIFKDPDPGPEKINCQDPNPKFCCLASQHEGQKSKLRGTRKLKPKH